jgi:hypothetical protein
MGGMTFKAITCLHRGVKISIFHLQSIREIRMTGETEVFDGSYQISIDLTPMRGMTVYTLPLSYW